MFSCFSVNFVSGFSFLFFFGFPLCVFRFSLLFWRVCEVLCCFFFWFVFVSLRFVFRLCFVVFILLFVFVVLFGVLRLFIKVFLSFPIFLW